jgi:hypothetical protein
MRTVFEKLRINYILIEEGQNDTVVDALIEQKGELINTQLVIDSTDLNRLFLKLSAIGIEVSLSEDFSCYETENGNLYTMDFEKLGLADVILEHFEPIHRVQQIRA